MKDKLTVILPIHNEVKSLERVIKEWDKFLKNIKNFDFELSLCEDGSNDGTKQLIAKLVKEKKYNIVDHSVTYRRGYGQAVREGIVSATGNWILCIDSDGQCIPKDFKNFWKIKNEQKFVMGHRFPRKDPFVRLIYSKMFYFYHKLLFAHKLNDPSCPYVLGKKNLYISILKYLEYMREGFWWGFVGACVKKNIEVIEIKVDHQQRLDGDTQVYKLTKMPSIIIRNFIGLIKLRLSK